MVLAIVPLSKMIAQIEVVRAVPCLENPGVEHPLDFMGGSSFDDAEFHYLHDSACEFGDGFFPVNL